MTMAQRGRRRLSLLTLPWEVRNLIYSKLFEEDYDVPDSPADLKKMWCLFPFWLSNSSYIHAPPPARSICQGLLGSCQQLRQETLERLESDRKRHHLKFKLDCMALRNGELYTSWLWLPCPLRFLDVLEVDLRVIPSDAELEGAAVAPAPDRFLNDPGFKLSELIEEFFHRGPSYCPVKVCRNDIEVKELVINIYPHASISEEVLQNSKARSTGRLPDGSPHPERIFQTLSSNYLLQRILRGKMKELILRYDGRVYRWSASEEVSLSTKLHKPGRVTKSRPRRRGTGGASNRTSR